MDGSLIVSGCTAGIGLSVGSDTTDNIGMEVCSSPYNGWFSVVVPRERLLTRLRNLWGNGASGGPGDSPGGLAVK